MIRTQRLLALGALALLLMAPTSSIANPGGNGDSSRDYTCGGSCHGDPGLSQPSDGTISIGTDTTAFSGTVTAVHVSASGMSLSGKRILGVFLLSSLNGNDDLPSDYGWSVIQDPNGGISNYVETVVPESGSATLTWVLRTLAKLVLSRSTPRCTTALSPTKARRRSWVFLRRYRLIFSQYQRTTPSSRMTGRHLTIA